MPAAEDVEAAAFQASEAPASARVDSVMCSPSFSVNPSCSSVDAAPLPPHPTVYAAERCSLRLLSDPPGRAQALGAREEAAHRCMGVEHPDSAAPRTLADNSLPQQQQNRPAPTAPQPFSPAPQLQFPAFPAGKGCASKQSLCVVCARPQEGAEPSPTARRLGVLRRSRIAPFWARDVSRFGPLVYWEPLGSTSCKRRLRNSPDPFGTGLRKSPLPAVVMGFAVFSLCNDK